MKKIIILLVLLVISSKQTLFAQIDTTANIEKSIIIKNDGSHLIGKILKDDGREILFLSDKIGKIYIAKADISEIKPLEEAKVISTGEYILESPFTTRYSFTANALPIKKNVNYAMVNLYGPEIHFALTNNFSIGVMTTWLGSPIGLASKYTFQTKNPKLNFALGSILGTSGYFSKGKGYGGLGWLTTTYGGRMDNISFSAGYGFLGNFDIASKYKGGPLVSLAGIKRIGKKTSFIFVSMLSITKATVSEEHQYYDVNGYYLTSITTTSIVDNIVFFLMPGMRFQKNEHQAFQISLAGVINQRGSQSISFPLPMCSWLFKL